MEEPQ